MASPFDPSIGALAPYSNNRNRVASKAARHG
jgi:hypothetical protein